MYFFHSDLNSVRPNNVFKRGRGRNKLANLCPIPLIKYSIKYVQNQTRERIAVRVNELPNCWKTPIMNESITFTFFKSEKISNYYNTAIRVNICIFILI